MDVVAVAHLQTRGRRDYVIPLLSLLIEHDDAALLDRDPARCAGDDIFGRGHRECLFAFLSLRLRQRSEDRSRLHFLAVLHDRLRALRQRMLLRVYLDACDLHAPYVAIAADLNVAIDLRDLRRALRHARLEQLLDTRKTGRDVEA